MVSGAAKYIFAAVPFPKIAKEEEISWGCFFFLFLFSERYLILYSNNNPQLYFIQFRLLLFICFCSFNSRSKWAHSSLYQAKNREDAHTETGKQHRSQWPESESFGCMHWRVYLKTLLYFQNCGIFDIKKKMAEKVTGQTQLEWVFFLFLLKID